MSQLTYSPIVELRMYTLHPGRRDNLIRLFEREFLETQEAVGIQVLGQFYDLDDPNRFIWLRGFHDMPARAESLDAFYSGPVWKAHREAANATMIDSENVLLLRLPHGTCGFSFNGTNRPSLGSRAKQDGFVAATIYYFDQPVDSDFIRYFENTIKPALVGAAASILAGDWRGIARDTQTRWYFGYMIICTILVTLWQVAVNDRSFEPAFRSSAFAVVSLGTTAGFVSEDYSQWGPFPEALLLVLFFVGGCTGSTTGAIKVFRFCILGSSAKWQLRALVHQHRVVLPTYNGTPVSDEVVRSVIGFIVLYLFAFAILGTAVAAFNVDMTTAFSGVAQALGNVGPGFGTVIGPAGNFSTLPEGAKWILSLARLLGRRELLAGLVLFTPTFWRG